MKNYGAYQFITKKTVLLTIFMESMNTHNQLWFLTIIFVKLIDHSSGKCLRVAGGYQVRSQETPYVALSLHPEIRCTAVIVSKEWVLGAAHCYFNHDTEVTPKDINIVTGIVDLINQTDLIHRQERRASRIIVHSGFKEKKLGQNDVALVQLEQPLQFDNHTSAIELSGAPFPHHDWKLCTVVGWGDIEENVTATHLVKLDVSASHSRDACHGLSEAQLSSLICVPEQVNGGGLCDGDSGGPLVCDGKLVGISHQVYKEIFSEKDSLSLECGMQDMVHTFMFMCKYLPWVKNYIHETPEPPNSCFVALPPGHYLP